MLSALPRQCLLALWLIVTNSSCSCGGAFSVADGGVDGGLAEASTRRCAQNNGDCSQYASCSDTNDGVSCRCFAGYAGDGMSCASVAAVLQGLRWELPCLQKTSPQLCTTKNQTQTSATLTGDNSQTYRVTLRFRGVIEPKTYVGGERSGFWQTGGSPANDTANIYKLTISAPAQTYYLNAGATRAPNALYCETLDYSQEVRATGNALFTLSADARDSLQIINVGPDGGSLFLNGVPPHPSAFDGQFIQMDVADVVLE